MKLELTKWQCKIINPYFDEIESMFHAGKPGGLLAQVVRTTDGLGYIDVHVLEYEVAKKVQEAIGEMTGHRPDGNIRQNNVYTQD
jgi:hypothetical protein